MLWLMRMWTPSRFFFLLILPVDHSVFLLGYFSIYSLEIIFHFFFHFFFPSQNLQNPKSSHLKKLQTHLFKRWQHLLRCAVGGRTQRIPLRGQVNILSARLLYSKLSVNNAVFCFLRLQTLTTKYSPCALTVNSVFNYTISSSYS